MGIGPFAGVGLDPVAYAQVNADGTSTNNSGLTTSRIAPGSGTYLVVLPDDLTISDDEFYGFAQSIGAALIAGVTPTGNPAARQYLVTFLSNTGAAADTAFNFVFYRSITPPVTP